MFEIKYLHKRKVSNMHPLQDMEHIKTSTIQNFNEVYKKYSSQFFKEKLVIIQERIKVCKLQFENSLSTSWLRVWRDANLCLAERLPAERSALSYCRAAVCGRAGWPGKQLRTPSPGRSCRLTGSLLFPSHSPGK